MHKKGKKRQSAQDDYGIGSVDNIAAEAMKATANMATFAIGAEMTLGVMDSVAGMARRR